MGHIFAPIHIPIVPAKLILMTFRFLILAKHIGSMAGTWAGENAEQWYMPMALERTTFKMPTVSVVV
jgi:hypothetical protein